MIAATWPRPSPLDERLLRLEPDSGAWRDGRVRDLLQALAPGDLLVLNDAATLPASLAGRVDGSGGPIEVRLAGLCTDDAWGAVLFGAGDWRTRTEDRAAPPLLAVGSRLCFGDDLRGRVEAVSPLSARLVTLRFDQAGDDLWTALYRYGRPVQYAYTAAPLELWHVQTPYASRPWAVEPPSAGRPLAWSLLLALRRSGVRIVWLTHAAGLSSTGDAAVDGALPLPERYVVSAVTVEAIARTRAAGGRVVAVGTTVVRALEGCARAHGGRLEAGAGITDLRVGAGFRPVVVDGILTGMHAPGASHFELLEAFASRARLQAAHTHAEAAGYLEHEFGDSMLILPSHPSSRSGGMMAPC